jgi:hypothetical protein
MTMSPIVIDVSWMREAMALTDRVYWVGALDPSLRNFDIILKAVNGTTYNSYLVRGDQGVAVIDSVKERFFAVISATAACLTTMWAIFAFASNTTMRILCGPSNATCYWRWN